MSLDIKYIKDTEGNNYFPVVHEKGVVDDNGTTLESKLQSKQDAISDIDTIRSKANTAIQSITVGTTTTGEAGSSANVTNTGTATEPVLSFTIPQGAQGIQGIQGPQGERGPQGNTGVQVDSVASIIHSIDPTATYAAADVAGADAVQDVLAEVTELAGSLGNFKYYIVSDNDLEVYKNTVKAYESGILDFYIDAELFGMNITSISAKCYSNSLRIYINNIEVTYKSFSSIDNNTIVDISYNSIVIGYIIFKDKQKFIDNSFGSNPLMYVKYITNPHAHPYATLIKNIVDTNNLKDNSISSSKLQNNSISSSKLQNDSVLTNHIKDENIRLKHLSYADILDVAHGKNYLDPQKLKTGFFIDSDGIAKDGSSYSYYDYIRIKPNTVYTATRNSGNYGIGSTTTYIAFYDLDKNFISSIAANTKTFTSPATACFIRLSSYNNAIEPIMEEGSSYSIYEEFNGHTVILPSLIEVELSDNSISSNKLKDGSVSTDKLMEHSVTPQKTTFFETTNLYDRVNDLDYTQGKYIDKFGVLYNNASYNTTGFIALKPNTQYSIMAGATARMICFFDNNKSPISSEYVERVSTFETGNATSFVRISFYAVAAYGLNYGLCEGSERLPYEPYSLKLSEKFLPGTVVYNVPFYLPKHIYVAAGRTIEIYYNQVMLYADKYNIEATCSIGKALDRKFQIVGDDNHAGNSYTLTITAYDDSSNIVGYGTSTIHVVSNVISSSKNVLPVGDSLTNNKPWLDELTNLSENIIPIGTRGNYQRAFHEGRSGASIAGTYLKLDGSIVYSYDNTYRGIGYGTAPIFDATQSYNIGDKVKIAYNTWYRYYVFKQNHAPGPWNESEVYCYSDGNPFYDYVNEKFSMNFYKTFFGITYDAIILFLGTNGMNSTPETNLNGALGIKNLIEAIREDEPTIPIIVVNTIFRSSQNGIGNQGNTDGYSAQSEYKYNADKKVLMLAKAINDLCGSMSNVYLCPVGFTHDSKYNFGNNKVAVNPRLTNTDDVYELQPLDSVHPQNSGYMQIADEIFSTLCAVFTT